MSDLIDRQAVIDLLKQMRKDGDMVPWEGKDVFARIRKLPTIQPEKAQLSPEDTTYDQPVATDTNVGDKISRQAAIDAVEKNACNTQRIMDAVNNLPPVQPEYEELTPEEAASEIASGSIMSAWTWLNVIIQIKQMGYAICRKK